ncbi:hypothetical protein BC629DRAFT_1495750 [Irpex lacteus]|nr:hypothetical protein BC629DRAFT_1495750 [Irpex lacteus]
MHYRQRYMHNEQAQINRLPSEILSHIFLHLQDLPIRLPNPRTYDRPRAQPIRSRSQASRVCRYWRQVILHTPGLWTMIRVSEESTGNFSPGMPRIHRSWKWAAVSLLRSGTLPVTLQFYIPDINPVRLQKDMPHLMNEAHRIQELQLIRCSGPDLQSFSPVIMKAHRLETLYLMAKSSRNHLPPEGTISYECPRLRVLSIGNSTFWRVFTVRELRHLSLAWQEWTSADFRGFLGVLRANPHLEELFLDNVNVKKEDLDDVIVFIDHLLPVHLSKLERLFIHHYTDAFVAKAYPLMTALHAILALPFHCTRLNIHENDWHYGSEPDGFDRREAFPVQRLFVTAQFVIGTDGVSACVIGRTRDDNYSLRSIHLAEVQELWLDAPARSRDESPALSAIADMENVTRLVLMRETSFWLEKLERAFPALTEVDVFTQYSPGWPSDRSILGEQKTERVGSNDATFLWRPSFRPLPGLHQVEGEPARVPVPRRSRCI